MSALIIDASTIAAALFQETHAAAAAALLTAGDDLLTPDLVFAELGNVIWKRFQRKEIDETEASELLADVRSLPLRVTPCADLVDAALRLALSTRRTVYDCLYLALAVRNKTKLHTADERLVNALANSPLAQYIAWIGQRT